MTDKLKVVLDHGGFGNPQIEYMYFTRKDCGLSYSKFDKKLWEIVKKDMYEHSIKELWVSYYRREILLIITSYIRAYKLGYEKGKNI